MTPSPTITLFSDRLDSGPRPISFAVSIVLHCIAVAVVSFSIAYKPPFAKVTKDYFSVRQLDLRTPEEQRRAAAARVNYPGPRPPTPHGKPSPHVPVLRRMAQAKPGPQTLIQADLPTQATIAEEIPVPQVVIWSPSDTPVKKIVPPLPEKPTAADVKPALDRPNQEVNLADISIASSNQPSRNAPVAASTTSPVAVHLPQSVQLPPMTTSQPTAQPTPAAVLSLSDLRMKEGTTTLPPVNETAASNAQGVLAPGPVQDLSSLGNDNTEAKAGGNGAGQGSGGTSLGSGSSGMPDVITPSDGTNSGLDTNGTLTATPITLPKDGRFGAVVVGDSLDDQFPEMAGVWSGRMAYTVYLHVGLARSWILQYSLPRSADAAAAGTVARLDAPWPYNIVRPNLTPGAIDADALMVHGFVNQAGHFESLSFVFPQAFPQAQFVLAALQQWQFRPAMQDGQSAKVEVLLIIPEQLE